MKKHYIAIIFSLCSNSNTFDAMSNTCCQC